MTFRVGMPVVLVGWDESAVASWREVGAVYPEVGSVYTIRAILPHKDSSVLLLNGIDNSHLGYIIEPGFKKEFFRPAVSPKVETSFTTGADPDSEQYDDRRRIPVSEWGCSA